MFPSNCLPLQKGWKLSDFINGVTENARTSYFFAEPGFVPCRCRTSYFYLRLRIFIRQRNFSWFCLKILHVLFCKATEPKSFFSAREGVPGRKRNGRQERKPSCLSCLDCATGVLFWVGQNLGCFRKKTLCVLEKRTVLFSGTLRNTRFLPQSLRRGQFRKNRHLLSYFAFST